MGHAIVSINKYTINNKAIGVTMYKSPSFSIFLMYYFFKCFANLKKKTWLKCRSSCSWNTSTHHREWENRIIYRQRSIRAPTSVKFFDFGGNFFELFTIIVAVLFQIREFVSISSDFDDLRIVLFQQFRQVLLCQTRQHVSFQTRLLKRDTYLVRI